MRGALLFCTLAACGTLQSPEPGDAAPADAGEEEQPDASEAGADVDVDAMPTTTELTPSKDSYVEDGTSVDTNFGASAQLRVKGNAGGVLDRTTWLSFDVHAFSRVTSANLRVSVVSLDTGNTNPIPIGVSYAPTSSDAWGESTITWNDVPPAGAEVGNTVVTDAQLGMTIDIDVTAAVATDTDGVATFVLTSPENTGRGLTFSSREGATKPVLRITGIVR